MPDHPLDNPVWEALRTQHACLARHSGAAARYDAEVAPFAAVSDDRLGFVERSAVPYRQMRRTAGATDRQ